MIPTDRGERGLRIGDLKYVSEPLDLGALSGNRFCIILRNVSVPSSFPSSSSSSSLTSEEIISESLKTLRETGFINFFGMQRFGNSSVPTHAVGLKLLQCKWTEAAELVMKERDGDSEEVLKAREEWNTRRDAKKALSTMPKWLVAERCSAYFFCFQSVVVEANVLMLSNRSLSSCMESPSPSYFSSCLSSPFYASTSPCGHILYLPCDLLSAARSLTSFTHSLVLVLEFYAKNGSDTNAHGALSRIPKNLRMMYVHAYQSYLWNSVTSARIRLYGVSSPVAGDLVYASEDVQTQDAPVDKEGKPTKESVLATSKLGKVKVLTEEDKGEYKIQDVVLPLPGYSVTYPGGELGDMYRRMMAADGLDADDMFRSQKYVSSHFPLTFLPFLSPCKATDLPFRFLQGVLVKRSIPQNPTQALQPGMVPHPLLRS